MITGTAFKAISCLSRIKISAYYSGWNISMGCALLFCKKMDVEEEIIIQKLQLHYAALYKGNPSNIRILKINPDMFLTLLIKICHQMCMRT
jgi:hypothetical protein